MSKPSLVKWMPMPPPPIRPSPKARRRRCAASVRETAPASSMAYPDGAENSTACGLAARGDSPSAARNVLRSRYNAPPAARRATMIFAAFILLGGTIPRGVLAALGGFAGGGALGGGERLAPRTCGTAARGPHSGGIRQLDRPRTSAPVEAAGARLGHPSLDRRRTGAGSSARSAEGAGGAAA